MFSLPKVNIIKKANFFITFKSKHDWMKPNGFNTGIKVYNNITKTKEPLIINDKYVIKWYTCGPTVYDSSHIGHASCYVKLDIIQKILKGYFNFDNLTVMNITDIDDKIIKKANYKKKPCSEISKVYEQEFWDDLKQLNIEKPNVVVRVTEHMDLIIKFIQKLETEGHAYKASDNSVYFNVSSYENYGKLQNIGEPQGVKSHLKSPLDFALWKSAKEDEPFWNSPWGNGRPGWHIECSALASHILGSNIDIHAGGIDLRFPHHENEEAQSCCYHHTPQWVNYWIHTGHLRIKDTEKMSKSLGNTILIRDMLKTTSSEAFRMACVMSPYRSIMEYSPELLETANNNLKAYKNFLISCEDYKKGILKASLNNDVLRTKLNDGYRDIHEALCDDFDTPSVIKILNGLVSTLNPMLHTTTASSNESDLGYVKCIETLITKFLYIFGIDLTDTSSKSEDFTHIMNVLNDFRQNVRNVGIDSKNVEILKLCDGARDALKQHNVIVKDHGRVSSWSS